MRLIQNGEAGSSLVDDQGRIFDPEHRTWLPAAGPPPQGPTLSAVEALCWLQRDSGHPFRPPIGVIGPREAGAEHLAVAEAVGRFLARCGFVMVCGGRQGVMEAVCAGTAAEGGIAVGLLPDDHWDTANPHVTIPIATGIGVARNAIIARAAGCLIAIGGGYGTLSEMALGLQFGRPVFALLDAPMIDGVSRLARVDDLAPALFSVVTATAREN